MHIVQNNKMMQNNYQIHLWNENDHYYRTTITVIQA